MLEPGICLLQPKLSIRGGSTRGLEKAVSRSPGPSPTAVIKEIHNRLALSSGPQDIMDDSEDRPNSTWLMCKGSV